MLKRAIAFRAIVLAVIFILIMGVFTPAAASAKPSPTIDVGEDMPKALAAEGISAESWVSIQAQMAAAEYHFTWRKDGIEGAYQAPNPEQGLGVRFNPAGLQLWSLADNTAQFGFALSSVAKESITPGEFSLDKAWITHQAAGLKESLLNTKRGIQYTVTLTAPVEEQTLEIFYTLSGSLIPHMDGASLLVRDAGGTQVFQLGDLTARDAAGHTFPAAFVLKSDGLALQVSGLSNPQLPLTLQLNIWTESLKLTASDAGADDQFGMSVAVSGDVIVVGAYGEDTLGTDAGAAYVFQRMKNGADVWGEVTKLTASDAAPGDYFGISVGVSGEVIVVGAFETAAGGAAYVFQRMENGTDSWGEVAKLTPSNPGAGNRFGYAVAVSGDVIVVGAKREDVFGLYRSGAAYVFQRMQGGTDAWGETARLIPSDPHINTRFGWSVAVSGDVIVVGAVFHSEWGTDAGMAYVFQRMEGGRDVWGQVARLVGSDTAAGDQFGLAVAVSGDVIVVGAPTEDEGGTDAGAAYVFHRRQGGIDAWGEVTKLTASDRAGGDRFGISVGISGDVIVVGAWGEDDGGADAGAAYVFHRMKVSADDWGEVDKLTAPDAQADDFFGFSAAISNDVIVVGARFEGSGGTDAGAVYVFQDDAENWQETTKNIASDAGSPDWFGWSVSVSGDVMVVGAKRESGDSGAAYVFHRLLGGSDVWGEVTKLTASDGAVGDYFGNSVAVSGDVIVVGSNRQDSGGTHAGAAYVFQRMQGGSNPWGEVAKLTASDAADYDQFGFAVDISGDVIVVGAYYDSDAGNASGSAYVFQRLQGGTDAWGQVAKLTASNAGANDFFGWSVGVSGDVIVVSAWSEDSEGSNAGAAYVFQRMQGGGDAWNEVVKLTASDAAEDDQFGYSVSVSGDVIVVGARWEDEGGESAGAAYVFQRMQGGLDAWGQTAKLLASDPGANDFFGHSVAVSGDVIVVGAWAESEGGSDAGAAYVFQRPQGGTDNWGQAAKLTTSDAADGDRFGWSTAVSGDVIVIGAYGDDDGGSAAGAAFVFQPDLTEADLSLTKADSPDPVYAGETLTYTLSVSNIGPSEAANLTVTDILPAGVTFQSANGHDWTCAEASGVVTCTRANLAVGTAPDITITVTAPSSTGDITNTAAVTADTQDPVSGNNIGSATTTVEASADLSLTKADSPDPVYAGETLTFTLSVSNAGPGEAANLTVTDTLPSGVAFQDATGDGWTCAEASGVVTCTRAALGVGDAPNITITVAAPSSAGDITNSAAVTSDTHDPDEINNSDDVITTIILWKTYQPLIIK
jgi:uncharacterized repeat protein (TIGR01451 family)